MLCILQTTVILLSSLYGSLLVRASNLVAIFAAWRMLLLLLLKCDESYIVH